MNYRVEGTFGGGARTTYQVHAASTDEARRWAEAAGITVSAVYPVEVSSAGVGPPDGGPPAPARLVECPVCGGRLSTEAVACPHCGHPARSAAPAVPAAPAPAGPTCHACVAAATTRCQSCGVLSCAQHLQSIYVSHGRGGAYELRCAGCYSSARVWQAFGLLWAVFVILGVLAFLSSKGIGPFGR